MANANLLPSQPYDDGYFDFVFGHDASYWTPNDEAVDVDRHGIPQCSSLSPCAHLTAGYLTASGSDQDPHPGSSCWPDFAQGHESPGHLGDQWETNTGPYSGPSTPRSVMHPPEYVKCGSVGPTLDSLYEDPVEADVYNYRVPENFQSSAEEYSMDQDQTLVLLQRAASMTRVRSTAQEMARWGTENSDGSWRCNFENCSSRTNFRRSCDLRKHYKRHERNFFCRHIGCAQATDGGFSTQKDRLRHEARHNPSIECEWDGCERLFSRQDNMRDHVRRVHLRQ